MRKLDTIDPSTVIDADWIDELIEHEFNLMEELLHVTGCSAPSDLLDEHEGDRVGDILQLF